MSLTAEELRRLLDYDPETGDLTWRVSNGKRAIRGAKAGSQRKDGYICVRIHGGRYYAHRLAWLHVHGQWPPQMIDHANGDTGDNRIGNLRVATRSQNNANMQRPTDNASGVKGVYRDKLNNRWVAQIRVSSKTKYLGRFDCLEDAAAAYERAAVEHFGEFARAA